MINVTKITKTFGPRTLFKDFSVNVGTGDRIALIGPNGSGKSTLLGILADEITTDSGHVTRSRNISIGYLSQEPPRASTTTLLESVLSPSTKVGYLRTQIQQLYSSLNMDSSSSSQNSRLKHISTLEAQLEATGEEYREHEAEAILSGLGFKTTEFHRPLAHLSGGWLMRSALAKLLFTRPDVLLLDEPTNHLDLYANLWFERFLTAFNGSVVITSHDRAFLNQVATTVIGLEPDEVVLFRGGYDDYLAARELSLEVKQAAAARQDREFDRQMKFVTKFRSKARKASQVQSRLKQLAKIKKIEVPRATQKVHFSFPTPSRSGFNALVLNNISKYYGDLCVYQDLGFTLHRGDKAALIGPNGAGKTTLLKILAGVLAFEEGERKIGHNVTTAYYAQHVLELLNPTNTIIRELQQAAPEQPEQSLRTVLGGFLFTGDDIRKPISVLSGGEKARVALAKLLVQPNNLLLMDEPTNHLDIASREILADALRSYQGTICLITHDRTLIDQVANKIVEIDHGHLSVHSGDYSTYQDRQTWRADNGPNTESRDATANQARRSSSEKERRILRQEAKKIDKRIKSLDSLLVSQEAKLAQLESLFSEPSNYRDGKMSQASAAEYKILKVETSLLWQEWETLSIKHEEINTSLLAGIE
jgi:ATP-binding cassette subfamily F protein 3